MPKNVLFSLKICENCQTLGALPPDSLATVGWGFSSHTPKSVILRCKFSSMHLAHAHAQTLLKSTKRPYMFL